MRAILKFSLTAGDRVTRQCPQAATFDERGEPKRNRTQVVFFLSAGPSLSLPLEKDRLGRTPALLIFPLLDWEA